jgi:hypothetical protein
MAADKLPTSFGGFKPVGHVMVGLPTQAQADALALALHGAGWDKAALLHFAPHDSVAELQAPPAACAAGQAGGVGCRRPWPRGGRWGSMPPRMPLSRPMLSPPAGPTAQSR